MFPNRAVTREFLATVTTPSIFGGALRRVRGEAELSIRRLEQKAIDRNSGGPPRFVELTKNLIEDMEKGKRLEGNRLVAEKDNRLEIYLWCCGVPKEDLPAWLETRRRVLSDPSPVSPESELAPEVSAQLRPAVKTALRRDVRTFIGRDAELHRILATADLEHGAPIYTIDGMPGVGKTALATRAAHLLADRFPDGRYFIELHAHTAGRAVADPADVLAGLLIALGVDVRYIPDTLDGRRDLWRDRLTDKRVLLILDDARDEGQIEPLLPAAAECLTLVTSRRRLINLQNAMPLALDMLGPGPATELFTTLAGRDAASATDQAAATRIVRLCGYLPLAITLLAGRLAHHPAWTIAELADEFCAATDRLGELDAGARVVRAAFDLSYRDLPPERELLFRRLGLHPGPDLDAHAAAALVGIDVATARWELESLYTDHLVDEPARGRYRLHDLLREYARALADAEVGMDGFRAQERLLDYFQHTATAADRWLARWTRPADDPPGSTRVAVREFASEIQALEWMRLERENLLACLDHDAVDRCPARTVTLAGVLAGLLDRDGPWPLACQLHQRAVVAAQRLGRPLDEANALNNLGAVQWRAGDYDASIDSVEAALRIYRELGNRRGAANALNNLGNVHVATGDYVESVDLHRRALALYQQLGDRLGEANALNNLGNVREETGDYAEAVDLHRQALALYHQLGNRLGEASALNNLGIVRTRTGLHAEAVDLHRQALALYRQLGNRLGEASALNNLGIVRTRTGLHAEAVELHRQALALFHELGYQRGEAEVLIDIGKLLLEMGAAGAAFTVFNDALEFARRIGSQLEQAHALEGIARCRVGMGDQGSPVELREAIEIYQRIGAPEAATAVTFLVTLEFGP